MAAVLMWRLLPASYLWHHTGNAEALPAAVVPPGHTLLAPPRLCTLL